MEFFRLINFPWFKGVREGCTFPYKYKSTVIHPPPPPTPKPTSNLSDPIDPAVKAPVLLCSTFSPGRENNFTLNLSRPIDSGPKGFRVYLKLP